MATHFFHSGMLGAPTNTNAAGSTLAIIRACLSTGFNLKTPQTATVASGVMTLTYSAPHGYEDKVWIRLDGAPGGSLVQRATASAGASSLTIPAPGFADGPVAGALSTRVAPADWEEAFAGTNIGVFRSKVIGPDSTRFFYRMADVVAGLEADMLRGFESMSDASTGLGAFPTVTQATGNGLRIQRSGGGTGIPWCLVADQRTCYVFLSRDVSSLSTGFGFGDFVPYSTTDLFNAFAIGGSFQSFSFSTATTHFTPRIAAGTGTSTTNTKIMLFSSSGFQAFPSTIDGGNVFSRPVLVSQGGEPRGEWRGLMCCSHNPVPSNQLFVVRSDVSGVSGRVAVIKEVHSPTARCVAFPLDQDWT